MKKDGIPILPDCAFISKHLLSFQLDCFLFPHNSGWVLEQQRVGQELFMARIERDPPTTPLRWMATRTRNSIDMFTATTSLNHNNTAADRFGLGSKQKGKIENFKLSNFQCCVSNLKRCGKTKIQMPDKNVSKALRLDFTLRGRNSQQPR